MDSDSRIAHWHRTILHESRPGGSPERIAVDLASLGGTGSIGLVNPPPFHSTRERINGNYLSAFFTCSVLFFNCFFKASTCFVSSISSFLATCAALAAFAAAL